MSQDFKAKTKIMCKICEEILFSSFPGEFVSCYCFRNGDGSQGCAIDENEYVCRMLGNQENFTEIRDDN
jgi:hypothetical protein